MGRDRRRWLTLAACSLGVFMGTLDATVVSIAVPSIQRALSATLIELQWLVLAYGLTFSSLLLLAGAVTDRVGRRRMLVAGLLIFAGGSTVAALSTSALVLICARAVTGAGAAAMAPATLALITAVFDDAERSKAIGVWAGATAVALAAGPLAGGAIVAAAGWEAVFWINVPVGVLAIGLAFAGAPEPVIERRPRIDVAGGALAALAILALLVALVQSQDAGSTGLVVAAACVAVASIAAFVLVERRSDHPLLGPALFRERGFSVALAGIFVLYLSIGALFLYIGIYYQQVRGLSPIATGLLYLPTTGAIVVLAPLAGTLVARLGARWLSGPGLVIAGAGLVLLADLSPATPVWQLAVGQLVLGLGVGVTFTPLSATIVEAAPVEEQARASAADSVGGQLGSAVGVAALGALIAVIATQQFDQELARSSLPDAVRSAAEASFSPSEPVDQVAAPADLKAPVEHAAGVAVSDAIGDAALVSAVLCVIGGIALMVLLPRRSRSP